MPDETLPTAEGEPRIKIAGENTQSTGPVKYAEGPPPDPGQEQPPPEPPPPPPEPEEEDPEDDAPAVSHRHKRSSKR